jgi:glycosyl transferase family 87
MARIFVASMIVMHALFLWNVRSRIARGDPDFTAFYTAGRMLRSGQGGELYDPAAQQRVQQEFTRNPDLRRGPLRFIHPPFEAVLFWPPAYLPYREAFVLWDILNLGIVAAISVLLKRYFLVRHDVQPWETFLALLAFFPIFVNFFQGQDAILLLLLGVLAFRAMDSGADFVAGCCLAAGLFRFQLVVPLLLILALWRGRKIVLGFATAGIALLALSVAIVGRDATLQYPGYVWRWATTPGFGRTPPSLLPNLLGLMTGWSSVDRFQFAMRLAVLAASAGLLILMAYMRRMANDSRTSHLALGCAVIAAVLVGYNTSTYDLCLLALPLVFVANYFSRELDESSRASMSIVAPAIPLLISPLWFLLGMRWQKFNLIAIFLLWWIYALRGEMLRRSRNGEQPHTVSRLT